jgi:hypothetical protein
MDITTQHNENIQRNRETIMNTAHEMIAQIERGELIEGDFPVKHRFAPGCYIREIFMAKGTRIIGKIHATEHFNIILKGKVTVITAEGSEYIEAPHTFTSKAGVQKVVYMHEDCIWQTVHVTNSTDLDEIEKEVIVESYDDLKIDGLLSQGIGVLK